MGASGTSFKQSGWGFDWPQSSAGVGRSYRKGVEYRYYMVVCGSNIFGYEWRPYGETGGVGSNSGISRPSWRTYCTNVDNGTWYRNSATGKNYKYDAGVKFKGVLGIDLSVERGYSNGQRIVYKIKGGNPKEMCGDTTYPGTAGKQAEYLR